MTADPGAALVGGSLGAFRIDARIGAGGMGEIYRAHDPRLGRDVAIKVLPDAVAGDPDRLARFEREARTLAGLAHPNLAVVHGFDEAGGRRFLVMELVDGESLAARLARGPLPLAELVDAAAQIADGLGAAHVRGVVHRDLKPANVMLAGDGRVKLLDFGLAHTPAAPPDPGTTVVAPISELGSVVGTLGYMAPEQALGEAVDPRADLFALGALIVEMATGRPAFAGPTPAAVLERLLRGAYDGDGLPAVLTPLVGRLLERDPARRPATAAEVRDELARIAAGGTPEPARIQSIAVLPFASLSGDEENRYFADGMAEEIIGALSKIEALRVVSRTSSFAFRGRSEDVRSIARALDVSTILEGSVRRSGRKLRVAVQLVEADTGFQLWSERFDRDLEDVFAVQDEIAESIARALRVVLSPRERRALQRVPTSNLEAYDLYLRGRALLRTLADDGVVQALYLFRRAVTLDERFTPGWLGLAEAAMWAYQWFDRSERILAVAVEASDRALAIAPELAEAQVARGIAAWLEDDDQGAIAAFEKALQTDPKQFDAAYFLARVQVTRGDLEAAIRWFFRAAEIQPDDYQPLALATALLRGLGRNREAASTARRCLAIIDRHLELHPEDARAYYLGAGCHSHLGDHARAREWAQRALELSPRDGGVLYNVACTYVYEGMLEEALALLERAVAVGWGNLAWLSRDPDMDPLRDHPRFQALLARIAEGPAPAAPGPRPRTLAPRPHADCG